MTAQKLGSVERSMLKALARNKQATTAEVAAMLPNAGKTEVDEARSALLKNHLVEPVPGSAAGAMRLTAEGATLAAATPDDEPAGSGGGDSSFR